MADEKYLQKEHNFMVGEYIGKDELYKRIMISMMTGLKNKVPLAIKACPEVTVNGE